MNPRRFLSRAFLIALGGTLCSAVVSSPTRAGEQTFATPGGGTVTVYGLRSDLFDPSARQQRMSEWCWAACIEMTFHRYGYVVDQESIVATVYHGVVDEPACIADILALLNHSWIDQNGRYFVARCTVFGVTFDDAISDLAADHPLIIGTHGHAMVLTSITLANNADGSRTFVAATVRDPFPYPNLIPVCGERNISFQEWNDMIFMARICVSPR
jgi:hypothetical protein